MGFKADKEDKEKSEPGVGQRTTGTFGDILDIIGKIPAVGGSVRRGLDVPQTYRNLKSKAMREGLKESIPFAKSDYEPPTPEEQNVKEGGKMLGYTAQAAAGGGAGGAIAGGLKAAPLLVEGAQVAGASLPSVLEAGSEAGIAGAGKQALLDMLIAGLTKGGGALAKPLLNKIPERLEGIVPKKTVATQKTFQAEQKSPGEGIENITKKIPTQITRKTITEYDAPNLIDNLKSTGKYDKLPLVTKQWIDGVEKFWTDASPEGKQTIDRYVQNVWQNQSKELLNKQTRSAITDWIIKAGIGAGGAAALGSVLNNTVGKE